LTNQGKCSIICEDIFYKYLGGYLMKKSLSLILILALVLTFFPSVHADAAIKLNKKSITLTVGQTTTLKVTGTSKTVKWTSSKKSVATVSSKGVVTGKAVGTAKIVATVSGKKYTCNVTVKKGFNSKEALKNLKSTELDLGKGVIVILENKYSYPIRLSATAVFYDGSGNMLSASYDDNYYFEKGRKCALYLSGPHDSNNDKVNYSSYKITYKIEPVASYTISAVKGIQTKDNFGSDNIMVEVTNNSKNKADYTCVAIIYYKNGNPIGYNYTYALVSNPGDTDYLKISFPYDENYNTVYPDDYEIFVNYAYSYKY